ncbi:hypothetical protein [Nostoc sp. NMS7]|uniref:hypothetical protein n=1 Tax=Nostoc sp. NMS7 TaxID=2815391 RepID=UPI00345842FC
MMKYKGYEAIVEFDAEAEILHGEVINIRDVITFQGIATDRELRTAIKSQNTLLKARFPRTVLTALATAIVA